MNCVGVVAIGRNEGERLRACLESLAGLRVVYVDSGSTDGSVKLARVSGAEVVELDGSRPFSAARARNEGLARLHGAVSGLEYVQFMDGDCSLAEGWLQVARAFLETHPEYAVVCGRRRERFPEASNYNRLCDLEWNTPVGDAKACGGDALMRVDAVKSVGGYREDVIAAEDDEVCVRLRQKGWKIARIDADMTFHDAAMTRFSQWWNRAKRAGHAYAQGAALHGQPPERHFVRDCRRIWFWGLLLPLLAVVPAWWCHATSLILMGGYLVLGVKIYRHGRRRGWTASDARLYAVFTVLAKFPGLLGMLQYHINQWRGLRPVLIEYKGAEKPT